MLLQSSTFIGFLPFGDQWCALLGNTAQVDDKMPSAMHSITFLKGESTFLAGFPEVEALQDYAVCLQKDLLS